MSLTYAAPDPMVTTPRGQLPWRALSVFALLGFSSRNLAIFAAGVLGAVLLGTAGSLAVPLTMTVFAIVALLVIVASRRSAYPGGR